MKRTIPILSIAALIAGLLILLTSCESKKAPDSLVLSAADTAGLAQFQSWKVMNERKDPNLYYQQGYRDAMTTATAPKTRTITKTRVVYQPSGTAATRPAKRKGWSKAAKGTA